MDNLTTSPEYSRDLCLSALGKMASGMVHNFNNLLMPILGLTDFVLSDPEIMDDKDELTEILKEIAQAANAANTQAAQIRSFYRPFDEADPVAFAARSVIDEATQTAQSLLADRDQASGITIHVEPGLDDLPELHGTRPTIAAAISAIITNAIEAMPSGGEIVLSGKKEGVWIRLDVRDNGVGMTDEIRRRCFEPLFGTKRIRGSGMGLSLAYGTTRRHDGVLKVSSIPNAGTTVSMWLPTEDVILRQEREADILDPLVKHHVLVADADVWRAGKLRRFLGRDQHSSQTTQSGKDARRTIASGNIDMVIVGTTLIDTAPGQLVKELRASAPDVPVIVVPPHPAAAPFDYPTTESSITALELPMSQASLQVAMAHATG